MITVLFIIGIICLCIKTTIFAVKAAWGITKFMLYVIAFPLIIVGLFVAGLLYLAFPLLLIGLVISLIRPLII